MYAFVILNTPHKAVHSSVCVPDSKDQQLSLCVFSPTPASCAEAQFYPILMNVVKQVRCWDPGSRLSGLLHLNLMCRQMMYWKPSHQGSYEPGLPGSILPTVVLRGELGRGCIFFWELHVSAIWISQTVAEGINKPPPHCSSGMGLSTGAFLWLMFVCVMLLFISLGNKCIINKKLP